MCKYQGIRIKSKQKVWFPVAPLLERKQNDAKSPPLKKKFRFLFSKNKAKIRDEGISQKNAKLNKRANMRPLLSPKSQKCQLSYFHEMPHMMIIFTLCWACIEVFSRLLGIVMFLFPLEAHTRQNPSQMLFLRHQMSKSGLPEDLFSCPFIASPEAKREE